MLQISPTASSTSADARPVVIAHRGASGYVPEHTLVAVGIAHAMGADYLEQDVVLSKDGVPLVLHDVCLDTVTDVARRFPGRYRADGRYYALDFTLQEIKSLSVSERFDPRTGNAVFPNRYPPHQGSFSVPTLEEELQFIAGLNRSTGRVAGIYPEVKSPAWHRQQGYDPSARVLELLDRYAYREKSDACYLQCFDFEEVKRIRGELGYRGRLVQLLADPGSAEAATDYAYLQTPAGLAEVAAVADGIGPSLDHIIAFSASGEATVTGLAANARRAGLVVHPYTFRVDLLPAGAGSFAHLLATCVTLAEIDGLFTDHPDQADAVLRNLILTETL